MRNILILFYQVIIKHMGNERLGYHSICLLSRELTAQYQALYNRIKEYLDGGYAIVYTLESNPSETLERMKQSGIDTEKYVKNGALNILGKESVYSSLLEKDQERTGKELVDEFRSIVSNVKNKSGKSGNYPFKGISVLFSADTSFELGDFKKHVDFERMIGKRLDMEGIELVCFYKLKSISDLGLSTLVHLLDYHQYTVHGGWSYREWNPNDTIELIREGMDEVLNGEMSDLLLRTLNLVYKTDNNTVISQPELFEANLRKAIGDNKTDMVVSSITEKIRKELSFG